MPERLIFPDPRAAADVLVLAQRAARLGDGTVRLLARDGILALTAAPLAPRTLLDQAPTILGLRAVAVDAELVCDLVVDATALQASDDPHALDLPEHAVTAAWAGISAPRSGWIADGEISAAVLAARSQWGIAAVAEAVPTDAGDDAVHAVRTAVWGASDDDLGGLPLGVAFAAFALGFIGGEERAAVRRNGPWARVSLSRGHVLVRSRVTTGLTGVRSTGRA